MSHKVDSEGVFGHYYCISLLADTSLYGVCTIVIVYHTFYSIKVKFVVKVTLQICILVYSCKLSLS
jgi:hypothetical protein